MTKEKQYQGLSNETLFYITLCSILGMIITYCDKLTLVKVRLLYILILGFIIVAFIYKKTKWRKDD